MLSIPTSPAFSPWHSFVGGLMLASCVHYSLARLGTVFGISGFLHRAVRNVISTTPNEQNGPVSDRVLDDSSSEEEVKRSGSRNRPDNVNAIHHAISPEDDAVAQSERTSNANASLFVNGLLVGGAILAAARLPLEDALGVRIFDAADPGFHLGRGFQHGLLSWDAAKRFIPTAFWGLLVGIGTKLGSGCTSGHFLCGLSRLSPRSIVATGVFFSVAVGTNLLTHPIATKTIFKTDDTPQSPAVAVLALLQIPALLYAFIVPRIVASREKSCDADEAKSLHEQAARFTAGALGLHFACGLAVTGMTRPSKVLGFLNLSPERIQAGQWDPSLAFVAIGGILPSAYSWFTTIKPRIEASRKNRRDASLKPTFRLAAATWRVPIRTDIDWRLVVGATLFGIGWGVTGLCPGPALVTFGASTLPAGQDRDALVHLARRGTFVGAMGVGGLLGGFV